MQALLAGGAAGSLALALWAAWRERARSRRRDLDRVGLIAWPTVQVLALIALAISVSLWLHT